MHKRKVWKIIYQSVNSGFLWVVKLQVIFSFNLYCLPSCDLSFLYSMTTYNFLYKKSLGKKTTEKLPQKSAFNAGWRGKQEPWSPLCVPSWSPHGPWERPDFWASSKQGAPGPATLTERRQRRPPEQEDLSTEQERHSLMFWGPFSVPTGQRTPTVGEATEEYGLWPQSQHPSAAL